MQYNALKRFFK